MEDKKLLSASNVSTHNEKEKIHLTLFDTEMHSKKNPRTEKEEKIVNHVR